MFSLVTKNISVGLSDGNQRNLVTKKRGACHMFLESPQWGHSKKMPQASFYGNQKILLVWQSYLLII